MERLGLARTSQDSLLNPQSPIDQDRIFQGHRHPGFGLCMDPDIEGAHFETSPGSAQVGAIVAVVPAEVPEAIRYLEEGHARGKVVITV